ncbi:hypothetical protein [Streptomyces chattanoogensis]|uniref:hypothetical protein n=1 Tax=Streptomyces chattanoogensis TaxID=66876 RepID=UPI0036AF0E02
MVRQPRDLEDLIDLVEYVSLLVGVPDQRAERLVAFREPISSAAGYFIDLVGQSYTVLAAWLPRARVSGS